MRLLSRAPERERRFHVQNFQQRLLPTEVTVIQITQDYLRSQGSFKRRVRRYEIGEKLSYLYEVKSPLEAGDPGKLEETFLLEESEYRDLLAKERDQRRATLVKTRYRHAHSIPSLALEWDEYHHPLLAGFYTLEVELPLDMFYRELPTLGLPPEAKLREITGEKPLSCRGLAKFIKDHAGKKRGLLVKHLPKAVIQTG